MQLTLLYHPGNTFYRLVLRPLVARCTSRINHKVTKSPIVVLTWVHASNGTTPSPTENIHSGSPTIMHSQYLRQNIDFKHKSTLVIMTYKSETRAIQETGPIPELNIKITHIIDRMIFPLHRKVDPEAKAVVKVVMVRGLT